MGVTITLFTHLGCPGGDAARRYLAEHGLPCTQRDVVRDLEARIDFNRLGGIGTPLLVVGERLMHGFDPEELEHLLHEQGGRVRRG